MTQLGKTRILNWITPIFLTIFIPLLITIEISKTGFHLILSYFLVLDVTISLVMTLNYFDLFRRALHYEESRDIAQQKLVDLSKYRVAAVIPAFNELPFMVVENAVTAGYSVNGPHNVFILDDSADQGIRNELRTLCGKFDINIVQRTERRGYKAGAINDWLRVWKDKYDFVFVIDADQRPAPGFLDRVMQYFSDETLAYIQFPQYYSNMETHLGLAAWLQQVPFLRIIMKGRSTRGSSFVLGSGVLMRVKPLVEIGGFYEKTVTEDIYTTVLLRESGYRGIYIDIAAIWKGQAPNTYQGYWTQQSRWSLGSFQLLPEILKSRLKFVQFWDFLLGVFYWLKVGLFVFVEMIAPFLYLVLGISLFRASAETYLLLYALVFVPLLTFYVISVRKYGYKLKEFFFHQGIQAIDSFPVFLSILSALSGKQKPFKVTPKNTDEKPTRRFVIPIYLVLILLGIAIVSGIFRLVTAVGIDLRFSIAINLIWASWIFGIFSIGLFLSTEKKKPSEVVNPTSQIYMEELLSLFPILQNAVIMEESIADYYSKLGDRIPDMRLKHFIKEEALESTKHASIYKECVNAVGVEQDVQELESVRSFAAPVSRKIEQLSERCLNDSAEFKGAYAECLLLDEELLMGLVAQFLREVLRTKLTPDLLRRVEEIVNDERVHFKMNINLSSHQ